MLKSVLSTVRRFAWYGFVIAARLVGLFWAVVLFFQNLFKLVKNPVAFFTVNKRLPPPVLQSPEFGEHGYLHLPNNTRIHYVAGGYRNAPLMLFLHGFPEFWYSWRYQLRYFKNDYRTVAIDLRGYGDSSKPTGIEAYTVDKLVEDVKYVIEGLGHKSCILVGHDWGGIVAWNFGTVHPEMVDRLIVLNAPHPQVFGKFAMRSLKQLLMSWYMFFFQLPYLPELFLSHNDLEFVEECFTKPPLGAKPDAFSAEDIEAYKYNFSSTNAFSPPINYYRSGFRFQRTKRIKYRRLPFPILLIFGTGDGAISAETALLSDKFASGPFELKYLEGISHWVQQEAPDVVNQTMENFLYHYKNFKADD